ncbi:hypothetical protein [Microcella frigidaquae]|uniref:Uncharacterized protein n=1 Tax=Microcella frigidaquae TaxID=424758 RepID=A0A840XJI9_9MICO|nr:hypothetical protein [Microcella frigidaquae]MBB5618456.1 hypothetical protein [Microcella frigidaquae]NHN44644.1 hypothetical protein [Microcella frigidaquae]
MNTPSEVDSLLFGLTSDQWAEVNGIASTVTAFAAVFGLVLAYVAVRISRQSAFVSTRSYIDAQFAEMLTQVARFRSLMERVDFDGLKHTFGDLYPEMQTTKVSIRQFEAGGLPRWDARRLSNSRDYSLSTALRALEYAVDRRFQAVIGSSSGNVGDQTVSQELDAYLQAFGGHAAGDDRSRERVITSLRQPFLAALVQATDTNRPADLPEISRLALDHVITLVQDSYAEAVHEVAPWNRRTPRARRSW